MTQPLEDVNERVGRATWLAIAGVFAGLVAFFLDTYTDAEENFFVWALIAAGGGCMVSSIVAFAKALSLKGEGSDNPGLGARSLLLFVFLHYSIAVFSSLIAIGMMDTDKDLGGFALLMLLFALVNALGGAAGGVLLAMFLYFDLTEKGWNSLAAVLAAGLVGLLEAGLCYVVQFNAARWLLPNM